MIYTVGAPDVYDGLIADGKKHFKIGPRQHLLGFPLKKYPGGICFRSKQLARNYCLLHKSYNGYAVYILAGTWKSDTYLARRHGHYSINKDLRIVGRA